MPASATGRRVAFAASLGGAVLTGALLFASDRWAGAAWLQLVAFAPFLVMIRRCERWTHAAWMGAAVGLGRYALLGPLLGSLPRIAYFGVPVYLGTLYGLFGLATYAAHRRLPAWSVPLAAAAAFAGVELVDSRMPMWGTALSLACAWSNHAQLWRVLSPVGTPGIAFLIVAPQALVVSWLARRTRSSLALLAALFAALAALLVGRRAPSRRTGAGPSTLRIAAVGWAATSGSATYERLLEDAVRRGARLVVSPEGGFTLLPGERTRFEERFATLARRHAVHLAVGYIDRERGQNRVAFFGPSGVLQGEYVKTHLVPFAESTRAGDGELVIVDVDGVKVGAMICQDDNFTDVARRYADAGVQIVVVPTFEMSPEVAPMHLRNARMRPVEGGFVTVRAVARGTSAILSPRGEVLSAYDHAARGPSAIVADAPL